MIMKNSACPNCLQSGHITSDCSNRYVTLGTIKEKTSSIKVISPIIKQWVRK
ncbi:hypothetical protein WUBG_11812, partial [Wuchereria bancrofti]